ncbi:MoxR family ATPase [Candidatus Sumerlaeota bacterium]|nr:MoxR family ATPase [Candidatus Sumerlaeota bacterium]
MKAQEAKEKLARLEANVGQIIKGKNDVVRMSIIALIANGHLLFEDVPGVGKTTLAHCLARSLGLSFQRIQFTSDLLPSDILGVTVYDPQKREFEFRPGPIFANVVLVDEINRTTPKTQSALLEAMNTAQVSIEKTTHDLPLPFMVIATQNPVESHGTFPLPQSQLDRFLMRLHVGYPEAEFEREILQDHRRHRDVSTVEPVLGRDDILAMQDGVDSVKVENSLVDYVVRLAQATRESAEIEVGVSTRGALALRRCAQGKAYMEGRDYCIPDDFKQMAVPALAHRIVLARTFEGPAESIGQGSAQIRALLNEIEVPV